MKKNNDSVDGTGMSTRRIERWSSIKKNVSEHHAYQKLHARTNNDLMTVEDFAVTKGTTGDSPVGIALMERRDPGAGDSCLDAAYLSRYICNLLNDLGRTPYIWIKKNTTHNSKGSHTWATMVRLFENDPDEFMWHYHARSTVESVFNAIKVTVHAPDALP